MNLGLPHNEEASSLSTREKLSIVDSPDQCEEIQLEQVEIGPDKSTYYDPHQEMYWSVWDPHITHYPNPDGTLGEELHGAHDQANFAANSQIKHFILQGREDLADKVRTKHGKDIAIAAIPAIPGIIDVEANRIWREKGFVLEERPITPTMLADFYRVMLHPEATINIDFKQGNTIIGTDSKLYCIDFTLDQAEESYREFMVTLMFEFSALYYIDWEELSEEMKSAAVSLKTRKMNKAIYDKEIEVMKRLRAEVYHK